MPVLPTILKAHSLRHTASRLRTSSSTQLSAISSLPCSRPRAVFNRTSNTLPLLVQQYNSTRHIFCRFSQKSDKYLVDEDPDKDSAGGPLDTQTEQPTEMSELQTANIFEGAKEDWVADHIAAGADVNAVDNLKLTPLIYTAGRGNIAAMIDLLKVPGIDVNYLPPPFTTAGRTALITAICRDCGDGHGDLMAVNTLLGHPDIDVNQGCTPDQKTPLWWAVYWCNWEVFEMLLARPDIDINTGGEPLDEDGDGDPEPPLQLALSEVGEGVDREIRNKMVEALLARPEIDVLIKFPRQHSMLMSAVGSNRKEKPWMAKMLSLSAQIVNQRTKTDDPRDTVYTALRNVLEQKDVELLKQILQVEGIDVNQIDQGTTPLMFAIQKELPIEIINELLKAPGIDVNLSNKRGDTALGLAANPKQMPLEKNNEAYVKALLALEELDLLAPRDDEQKQVGNTCPRYGRREIERATIEQRYREAPPVEDEGRLTGNLEVFEDEDRDCNES